MSLLQYLRTKILIVDHKLDGNINKGNRNNYDSCHKLGTLYEQINFLIP